MRVHFEVSEYATTVDQDNGDWCLPAVPMVMWGDCLLQCRSADYYHVVNCAHYACADCPWAVIVLTELPGAQGSCPTLLILYSECVAPRSNCPSSTSWGSWQYCPPNGGLLSRWRVTRCCQGCPCHRRLRHLREEPIVIGLIHRSLSCWGSLSM